MINHNCTECIHFNSSTQYCSLAEDHIPTKELTIGECLGFYSRKKKLIRKKKEQTMINCKDCNYWTAREDQQAAFGFCRKYCPTLIKAGTKDFTYTITKWPETLPTDCCGEGIYRPEED